MSRGAAYEALLGRGCLCGTGRPQDCPVHPEPRDNRGIRAYFEAGMPRGFPSDATCGSCGAKGLMYPAVDLDRGEVPAGEAPAPSLVCPNCSCAANESYLRFRAGEFGHKLNARCVFTTATHLLVESATGSRLGEPLGEGWQSITDPDEYRRALDNLTPELRP